MKGPAMLPTAGARSSPWPDVVWDAPMLRGLDARARAEIEAAGRIRKLRAGEVLYAAGDPADALYVVASGVCVLFGVRRGDAGAAMIRRAGKGDVLGEEATVTAFSTRHLEARCESAAVVAEVPLVVLRRAVGRAGGAELLTKVERALRRAATLDLLRTTSFTRGLAADDLEVLLDSARHVHVVRGEHVYRAGEHAADAFLVADGLLQAQTDDEGKPRVEAYLARGDLFGEEELEARDARAVSVVASGPTWLIAIPRDVFVAVARRNRTGLTASRRLRSEAVRLPVVGSQSTAHVFRDLYRMRVARSLLVIDQDACLRCGHCAWSCADVHEDGVSRLVRRGDKIVVSGDERVAAPLLVPNSCQHCKNPSCMIDCPTGAIGRDARGEVFIREDLCTGCGSCAKACPWANIQMAPRERKSSMMYPAVAVKCDLCKGVDGGPACVASCPTQAIARIDPNAAFVELGAVAPVLPPRAPAWPWVGFAALSGLGAARLPMGPWGSGIAAGFVVLLLVAYSAAKRRRVRSRAMHVAHLALGAFACGVTASHVESIPMNAGGALAIAMAVTLATGVLGALIGTFVPRMLTRVERKSVLPEELAARTREIDEKVFAALSGKSELVKTLYRTALGPYRNRRFGPLVLLLRRRTLRDEERAIHGRLEALSGGKRPDGIDEVVRLVVEHRAVRAQRLLTWTLRGWLVPHLAATTAVIVLVVLHVIAVVR